MANQKGLLLCTTLFFVSACASTPNVVVGYYESALIADAKVTRTATCKKVEDESILIAETELTLATQYSANPEAYQKIDFSKLDAWFASGDLTITHFDDGRLKSVNAKSTGAGGEIVKAAIDLVSGLARTGEEGSIPDDECTLLNQIDDDGVTVIYEARLDFGKTNNPLKPTNISATYLSSNLPGAFPEYAIRLSHTSSGTCGDAEQQDNRLACSYETSDDVVQLKLKEPARVKAELAAVGSTTITSTTLLVPQSGTPYSLPIQKPPFFGENRFALTLSEAGTITSIGYGKTSGVSSALGAVSATQAALAEPTDKELAEKYKAEADKIVQQRRAVACRKDSDNCT